MWPCPSKIFLALLRCLLSRPGFAQPLLEIDHKVFQGGLKLAGRVPSLWVELGPLTQQLGWARHPGYSGWCLTRLPETQDCVVKSLLGPDKVYWEGQLLATQKFDGKLFVSLNDLAKRTGWSFDRQGDRWSVQAGVSLAPVRPLLAPARGQVINLKTYPVPPSGHLLVIFYTQYCPSCWKYFPVVENLHRNHPELELLECDIEDFGSPMSEQFGVRATPWLRIYDEQNQLSADGAAAEEWLERNYGVTMPTQLKCVGAPKR